MFFLGNQSKYLSPYKFSVEFKFMMAKGQQQINLIVFSLLSAKMVERRSSLITLCVIIVNSFSSQCSSAANNGEGM